MGQTATKPDAYIEPRWVKSTEPPAENGDYVVFLVDHTCDSVETRLFTRRVDIDYWGEGLIPEHREWEKEWYVKSYFKIPRIPDAIRRAR